MEWELEQSTPDDWFDWDDSEWIPGNEIVIDDIPGVDVGEGGDAWSWWDDITDVVTDSGGTISEPGDGGFFDILDYVIEPETQIGGIDDAFETVEAYADPDTDGGGGGFFDTITDVGERFESDVLENVQTLVDEIPAAGIRVAEDVETDLGFEPVMTRVADNISETAASALDDVSSTISDTVNSGNDSLLADDMLLADAETMQIAEQAIEPEPAMEYTMAATDDFGETMEFADTAPAPVYDEQTFDEPAYDAPAFEESVVAFDEPAPAAFEEPAPVAVYEEPEPDLFSADVESADATAASADALWDDLG